MSTPEDPYADRLRDVLRSEADRVDPPADGLATIRARIDRRSFGMRWFRPLAAVSGVAVIAAGIGIGVAVTRDSDTQTIHQFTPGSSTSPSPQPIVIPPTPQSQSSAAKVTVPIYYVARQRPWQPTLPGVPLLHS